MEVELHPHVGAGPFRLGVPLEDAVVAAEALEGAALTRGASVGGQVKVVVSLPEFSFVLCSSEGAVLNAVEVSRFRDEDADVRVLLRGVDVFRTPSDALEDLLRSWGHRPAEECALEVPDLAMIFACESSFEHPVDEEGDPLYFDHVLVSDRNHPAFA